MDNRVARTAARTALFLAAAALAPAAAEASPIIKVDPPVIDLGVIEAGNEYERFLEITNVGDGVLVITDVKTSCGCTAVAVDGVVELTEGQSQRIRVTFDSKNMDGPVKKNVIVSSSDPKLPKVTVPLTADVHAPIRWEPKYIQLSKVRAKDGFEQVVQLQTDRKLELEVKETFILGGTLRNKPTKIFDLEPRPAREDGDRDVHEFVVRLRPDLKPRKISETMHVVTNLPAPNDTLKLALRGEIVGRIRVAPNFAVLPVAEPGTETVRDLTLTASDGTFQVLRAEVPDSPVRTEILPHETGKQTVVRLIYTGEETTRDGRRMLTIETDDPEQRVIEIQVRYQTRELSPKATPAAARDAVVRKKTQGP